MEIQTNQLNDGRKKNWFWDYNCIFDTNLTEHAKLIRLFLARCADNDSRQSFPSINTIAQKCSISRPTVKRALAELEETGWLKKAHRYTENGDFTSNIYTLLVPEEKG